jgi:hypothetical protein
MHRIGVAKISQTHLEKGTVMHQKSKEVVVAPVCLRQDHDPPSAIAAEGWSFHHVGIPTDTPRVGERYLPALKMYVSGFESSSYGIQWMRFDADAPFPEIVKTVPHVAFEVDDLEAALRGKEILVPPNSPSEGVRVAMIVDDGAPIELLQFTRI